MAALVVRSAAEHDLYALDYPGLRYKPGFEFSMLRVAAIDDEVVGTLLTERFSLAYGRARLRVIGISIDHHDDAAVREALIHDALAGMMEHGAHMALVHDPQGFFSAYGFSPVWPYYRLTFATEDALKLNQNHGWQLRPPHQQDIPQMAALYEKHWAGRVTFTRSPELWFWRSTEEIAENILVAIDPEEQVQGYIAGIDFASAQVEVIAETSQAAAMLLKEAARHHDETNQSEVNWYIPPDDYLVNVSRHLLDIRIQAQYYLQRGWLGRLIDTPALVDTLLPEIAAQAQATFPDFDPAALRIRCDRDRVHISLPGTAVSLNHQDFIQIVFGILSPNTLLHRGNFQDEQVQLLQSLFPPRIAALGCWDWF